MQIAFFQTSLDEASRERAEQIRRHFKALPIADFDSLEKDSICKLVADQFSFPDLPCFANGPIERDEGVFKEGDDWVHVTFFIPFSGDPSLFHLYHRGHPIPVPTFKLDDGVLFKTYRVHKRKIDTIDREVEEEIELIKKHLEPVCQAIPLFNQQLLAVAREAYDHRAFQLNEIKKTAAKLSESKFTIRKRSDGSEKLIVPIQRKAIPVTKQSVPTNALQEHVLEIAEYDDILRTISAMVKVIERTPSVFARMDEESLRTILLVALNGLYEGQATGETFNGRGKTDILIRHDDRNVFIAECLMWKGPAYVQDKMDNQLFRYAMWRDSKLALVIFNRGSEFTRTIDTMRKTISSHAQCIDQVAWKHESGARYWFRRADDPERKFLLTALAFDVPDA